MRLDYRTCPKWERAFGKAQSGQTTHEKIAHEKIAHEKSRLGGGFFGWSALAASHGLDGTDGDLAGAAVFLGVEADLLALDQAANAGPL